MPRTFASVVAASFSIATIVFLVYDWFVQRRNKELATSAARSNKLVSSLFPGEIKDRVLAQQDVTEDFRTKGFTRPQSNLATATPLAKVYPSTTVLFMDLNGFTSWSNERRPEEVFELLETLYSAFDEIAQKHSVFKVSQNKKRLCFSVCIVKV